MVSTLDSTRRLRDFGVPLKIITNEQKFVTPGFSKKKQRRKKRQNAQNVGEYPVCITEAERRDRNKSMKTMWGDHQLNL